MENIEDICNWLIDDDHDEFNLLDHESIYNYRRPRLIKPRIDWFNLYDAIDFVTRFRITKENFVIILEKIEHKIRSQTERNNCIPPIIQLLTTLRFFSTGSFAITIADFIGISETSALRIIHKVSFAIAELHKEFIKFPSDNNGILSQVENYQLSGFIRIIGAIDCFHVRIRSYGGENGELFRNGKGFFPSMSRQSLIHD
ncbi:putative nuclease HARBI1 [Prorops nasuta]|uniref:putative nuclease HARBI1 n=1 Tax=Prorops nasuta TaxID=863751 RepID=UPI0034CD1DE5